MPFEAGQPSGASSAIRNGRLGAANRHSEGHWIAQDMAQIFHRSANTIARVSMFGAVFLIAGVLWAALQMQRSPYFTYAGVSRMQPVPFSHQHH